MLSPVRKEVDRVKHWRHKIELPDGVVTPGTQDTLQAPAYFKLPGDLRGKSVLDIGCSDGFYSFWCEKQGASRVLAVDNFSSVFVDSPGGFHTAHKLLNSRVEFRQADLFDLDARETGRFDLVLCLGVLYHLRHPLLALERLAELCRDRLILETESAGGIWEAFRYRLLEERGAKRVMEFHEDDGLYHDPTNWWTQSPACTAAMLRSSGFCAVSAVRVRPRSTVFHAFHPRHGRDVEKFIAAYGPGEAAAACRDILHRDIPAADLERFLKEEITISQFAAVRQQAAVLRGKRRFQNDR